jgi:REP element-mobilizing transposase RayT
LRAERYPGLGLLNVPQPGKGCIADSVEDTTAVPQSLANVLAHVVFSTKERRPWLQKAGLRLEAHCYIGGIAKQMGCDPVIVGGVEDHVHLLLELSRTRSIADVIKELKRGSSVWIKQRDPASVLFAWQSGYGAY